MNAWSSASDRPVMKPGFLSETSVARASAARNRSTERFTRAVTSTIEAESRSQSLPNAAPYSGRVAPRERSTSSKKSTSFDK